MIAFAALFFPLLAIHLIIAWRDLPPANTEFDKPTIRALYHALAWGVFVIALLFSVTLIGLVWPTLFSIAAWVGLGQVRRRVSLQALYRFTLPLIFVGMGFVILLFQAIFGDSNFGLFSVFPVD